MGEAMESSLAQAAARRQAAIDARCDAAAASVATAKDKANAARQRHEAHIEHLASQDAFNHEAAAHRLAEQKRAIKERLEAAAFRVAEVQRGESRLLRHEFRWL